MTTIEVQNLVIHATSGFGADHAVPKAYVDTAVGTATARIDTLLAGSETAYDTLIELKTLMDDNSSDLATAVSTRVGELSEAITAEAAAARGFEGSLRNDIGGEIQDRVDDIQRVNESLEQETLARQNHVQEVRDAVSDEIVRAEEAEQALQTQHEQYTESNSARINEIQSALSGSVVSLGNSVDEVLATKVDVAPGYATREDGALQIDNDHYLYLGSNWRLRASQGSKRRRLEFEHSDDATTWYLPTNTHTRTQTHTHTNSHNTRTHTHRSLAVPFIRGDL